MLENAFKYLNMQNIVVKYPKKLNLLEYFLQKSCTDLVAKSNVHQKIVAKSSSPYRLQDFR